MPIAYFAEHQNDVFVPALAALLVATAVVVLPVVFAPALRRLRRRRALFVLAGVLAVVAVVVALLQTVAGFQRLDEQRSAVQRAVADQYGIRLTTAQVSTLLEGGTVQVRAAGKGADAAVRTRTVELRATGADHDYTLNEGTRGEMPRTA